ncbi:MAG: phosphate-starvation-inducible PsiE family protein [Pseudomonadota bacterium]
MNECQKNPSSLTHRADRFGRALVGGMHLAGLFILLALIIWAVVVDSIDLFFTGGGGPGIKDILLFFIYLEIVAMVGIYFCTRQLPVQFLLYIAITALTRLLAIDIKTLPNDRIMVIAGAILLVSLSVLILRFASHHYPGGETE